MSATSNHRPSMPLPQPRPARPSQASVLPTSANGAQEVDQNRGEDFLHAIEASEQACRNALAVYQAALKNDPKLADELAKYEAAQSNAALEDAARKMGARVNAQPVALLALSELAAKHLAGRKDCEGLLQRCAAARARLDDMGAAKLRAVRVDHAVELRTAQALWLQYPRAALEILDHAIHKESVLSELSHEAQEIVGHRAAAMALSRQYAALQDRASPAALAREYAAIEAQIARRGRHAVLDPDTPASR